jgi:hypothetical protein
MDNIRSEPVSYRPPTRKLHREPPGNDPERGWGGTEVRCERCGGWGVKGVECGWCGDKAETRTTEDA